MIFQLFDFLRSCVFHFLDLSFSGTPGLQFWTLGAIMWPPLTPIWPPLGSHFGPAGPFRLAFGPPLGYHLVPQGSHWFAFGHHGSPYGPHFKPLSHNQATHRIFLITCCIKHCLPSSNLIFLCAFGVKTHTYNYE